MAINSGTGPHRAWLNGLLVLDGSVEQQAVKKSSTFCATLPLNGGAESAFSSGGSAVITVQSVGGSSTLLTGVIDSVDFDYIQTKVRVSGRDVSAALHEQQSSEKFVDKTGSEITQELVSRTV